MRPGKRPPIHPPNDRTDPGPIRRRRLVRAALSATVALATLGALGVAARATPGYAQAEVRIHGHVFRVDVADTNELQTLGLGGREHLGPQDGMLFVYADRGKRTFWMRGMRIPIDMIWLDNHRVVHIEHDVPPPAPGTPLAALPTYAPEAPANLVLELAAGRAKAVGLHVGDQVDFRFGVR